MYMYLLADNPLPVFDVLITHVCFSETLRFCINVCYVCNGRNIWPNCLSEMEEVAW